MWQQNLQFYHELHLFCTYYSLGPMPIFFFFLGGGYILIDKSVEILIYTEYIHKHTCDMHRIQDTHVMEDKHFTV